MKKFALLAAIGAALGSLARFEVGQLMPLSDAQNFPWATLTVNIVGAFLIGAIAVTPRIMENEMNRHFLVTGVLGGFTTYSAFAVDLINLNATHACAYLVSTFVAGIWATHIGSMVTTQ